MSMVYLPQNPTFYFCNLLKDSEPPTDKCYKLRIGAEKYEEVTVLCILETGTNLKFDSTIPPSVAVSL